MPSGGRRFKDLRQQAGSQVLNKIIPRRSAGHYTNMCVGYILFVKKEKAVELACFKRHKLIVFDNFINNLFKICGWMDAMTSSDLSDNEHGVWEKLAPAGSFQIFTKLNGQKISYFLEKNRVVEA